MQCVAFDVGGVLAKIDIGSLSEEERLLFTLYMNRFDQKKVDYCLSRLEISDRIKALRYAKEKMEDMYLRVHKLDSKARTTLTTLRELKIVPSIWTNNIEEIGSWLNYEGLYELIDPRHVYNSYFLGCDKPSAKFYFKAVNNLGIPKERILFLDDSLKNVKSASELGIASVLYDPDHDDLEKKALEEIEKRGKIL